jgi:cytochrome b6-f complex subunit 5|tara:strand:+ start:353 stop:466 length:114 start_codon:yes stop_codon:yes gene_type:complete
MVEPLLTGIVLGMMLISLLGLFVAAYLQFKRGNELAI